MLIHEFKGGIKMKKNEVLLMILTIIALVVTGIVYNNDLNSCKVQQSPFCYTIQCPCDTQSEGPCFGYAIMPGPKEGQYYCSNAPLTLVDNNGNII